MSAIPTKPFPGLQIELSDILELGPAPGPAATSNGAAPAAVRVLLPSSKATNSKNYLPGQPRIALPAAVPSDKDADERFKKYLRKSHLTNELDDILPFMKYIFVSSLRGPAAAAAAASSH